MKYFSYAGVNISIRNEESGEVNVKQINNHIVLDYPCKSLTKCTPYIISLPAGSYLLRAYGASGGDESIFGSPGCGGISEGILKINETLKLFLYIGGKGTEYSYNWTDDILFDGGYNGGGRGYGMASGGGGSTDFRFIDEILDLNSSYFSRILVAAGGGGWRQGADHKTSGGNGGGLNGEQGTVFDLNIPCVAGQKGCIGSSGDKKADGDIWAGGNAIVWGNGYGSGGGGGGYYGGGTCGDCSGSGGSGFCHPSLIHSMTDFSNHKGNGKAEIYFLNSNTINSKVIFNHSYHTFLSIFLMVRNK